MKRIAFTSITTNYLPKARVLAHSVKRHSSDVSFVLVVAETFDTLLLQPNDPFDRVITVDELGIPALPANLWVIFSDGKAKRGKIG